MKLLNVTAASLAVLFLISCGKKDEVSSSPPPQQNVAAPMPDVGKVDKVQTSATGFGQSVAEATTDAMKLAILQVNGATIESQSVQAKFGLDVTNGKDALSLRASAFAEAVAQSSGGAITDFKIVDIIEPKSKNGQYKVSIEANIAHFTEPASTKKLKVVVAPVRFNVNQFVVGNDTVPATFVAESIQRQVANALTNTGRFSVLDRQNDSDIQQELDMIRSGEAPRAEHGKLGQAVTADVIWIGSIDSLAYSRHARQLRTSDRELVSYSGGWAVSQKLVNVATRQVLTADSLAGTAKPVAATTLGTSVDSRGLLQEMETAIVRSIVDSIVSRTFPITVVSRDGNSVVLSQGGQSLKVGQRYAMVIVGKEIKDPQTGESLGRMEAPCCELVVDKVSTQLSYGHLEGVNVELTNLPEGALQLRESISSKKAAPEADEASEATEERPKKRAAKKAESSESVSDIQSTKEDGKW